MEKQQVKVKNILKYRAYRFSLDIIDFLTSLPKHLFMKSSENSFSAVRPPSEQI
jgi:hypothetical protein